MAQLVIKQLSLSLLIVSVLLVVSACVERPLHTPPPSPVPPNGSLVTATVVKHSIWDSKLLEGLQPGLIVYSFTLEIHSSQKLSAQLDSFAKSGDVLEVFSMDVLAPELVGKQIRAILRLEGDTSRVRWWISQVQSVTEQ